MKFAATIALTAAAAQLILAQHHGHSHHHKKHIQNVSVVKRDMATVYVTEDGEVISLRDVCAGLAAKRIRFKDGDPPAGLCDYFEPATTPYSTAAPEPTSSVGAAAPYQTSSTEDAPYASSAEPTPTENTSSVGSYPTPAVPSPKGSDSGVEGIDLEFPDGEIDCNTFPSAYGAVPIDYHGLNGWIGIQKVTIVGDFVEDIVTGIAGDDCLDNDDMCSYACPPGYQKSQWPSTQGATGQSVGGLKCSGGKLWLTNPELSRSLCIKGTGGVMARNEASDVVSICRTDYPGTESENVPALVEPGETVELTCPDSSTYYRWKGMDTSAQYYLNPIGVPPKDGCRWGKQGSNIGNWAPICLGVSKNGGLTWMSIIQNLPSNAEPYNGTVEIVGDIDGFCKYENGRYCGATGCNNEGCTVAMRSGEATYIISDTPQ